MKNLNYYKKLKHSDDKPSTYLNLIQGSIGGGKIKKSDIDIISKHPFATAIDVSGLSQETFDYFIENYGRQFISIGIFKCPSISDLSKIETLNDLEYVNCFWNQKAVSFWDFSKTKSLKGFSFEDFNKITTIENVSKSPNLEELEFGDGFHSKFKLDTLNPLSKLTKLKSLKLSAKKILDGRIEPLGSLCSLKELFIPSNLFTTEQIAWLKSKLPKDVKSDFLNSYYTLKDPIDLPNKTVDTLIIGKRKPFINASIDAKKFQKYKDQFNEFYTHFLDNPNKLPVE